MDRGESTDQCWVCHLLSWLESLVSRQHNHFRCSQPSCPLPFFAPRQVWSTSGAVQGRPQNGFKRNSFLRLPSKKRLANSWTVTLLWMPFLTETYILSWTDIPRNLRVVEDVRGNLQSHELDVICMVKRYASNDCLEQDLCLIVSLLKFQYWKKHTYTWMNILCRTLCCTNHAQDV